MEMEDGLEAEFTNYERMVKLPFMITGFYEIFLKLKTPHESLVFHQKNAEMTIFYEFVSD